MSSRKLAERTDCHFSNKKLTFAKTSGIVTGDAPVSYWLFFPYLQGPSQKSLRKLTRPGSSLLKWPICVAAVVQVAVKFCSLTTSN